MHKEQYLNRSFESLKTLMQERSFNFDLAQVRSRAIQEEFVPDEPSSQFTFNSKEVWKYCDYIFSESSLLLRESVGSKNLLLNWIKTAAQNFEFLAKFADADDKELLLINSALCYHIAGYQANALCIAKLIEPDVFRREAQQKDSSPDQLMSLLFRRSLVRFLQHDIAALRVLTSKGLEEIQELQTQVTEGIANRYSTVNDLFNLTAHAFFQQSLEEFVNYCISGNEQHFVSTLSNLTKSHSYFQKIGDVRFSVITSELRTIFNLFVSRGTWAIISKFALNLLDDGEWQLYLRNLALNKSIIEFWLSQVRAIEGGLLSSRDSLVIQMPTSAGKTFIAELGILAGLTQQQNARCLYIAPYRALVNEVEERLVDSLGVLGFQISNLIGGFEIDVFQQYLARESDVLVATPEKVDLFLRTNPDYFSNIAVIVVDEGHIVDEGIPSQEELGIDQTLVEQIERQGTLGRGVLLELLVTRLKRKLPDARVLFLSAVVPEVNANDFVTWLSSSRSEPLRVSPEERPSRQVLATFSWATGSGNRGGWNGLLEYIGLPELPNGRSPFVPYFLEKKQYFTGKMTPKGQRQRKSWPADPANKSQSTAMLASRSARTGPVLVFCATTKEVRTVTDNIITSLTYLEASGELPTPNLKFVEQPDLESYHLAIQWLGEDHQLTRGLCRGVGLHYGPLPDPVRRAVESDFKSGKLQILVSTNTLGQGVNLPIKTAIIYSLMRRYTVRNPDGSPLTNQFGSPVMVEKPILRRDFWNICGRAGRAGKETEGHIIFVISSQRDADLLEKYKDASNLESQGSALFKLLQALVEARISQTDLIGYLDSHILALLVEEVVDTPDEDKVKELLEASLVGVQAERTGIDISPLVTAISERTHWIINDVTDAGLQRAFSATGLRLQSCRALELAAITFIEEVSTDTLDLLKNSYSCDERLLEVAFYACTALPEMKSDKVIPNVQPQAEFQLLKAWVSGKQVSDIYNEHWNAGSNESFSEYVADRLVYKLPWGINGFLQIVAHKLGVAYEDLPVVWQNLSLMTKFGVSHVVACWANSIGISSRTVAINLAKDFQFSENFSFFEFLPWITNLPIDYILHDINASKFDKQRLIDTINQMVPDKRIVFEGNGKKTETLVEGIEYDNRLLAARLVEVNDELRLDLDRNSSIFDRNAIRILFRGQHIGYIPRDIAKIISREIRMGRKATASVKQVQKSAGRESEVPQIQVTISVV